jgi:nucleoside-diphosphate-sugar epimerase
MNHAIISGATGMVGNAVTKFLIKKGVEVICLGRKLLSEDDIYKTFGKKINYLNLDMSNIEELPEIITKLNWQVSNNCIFYNFAWSGSMQLTDGSFKDQLNNVTFAANAIKVAKKIGCLKFINAGSLEETYAEQFLSKKSFSYNSSQTNYALSKIATRDMCNIVSYLEKIDYVQTRLSVPLSADLSEGNYIARTLTNISLGRPYEIPKNDQLFDIIFLDDVAEAYFLIGHFGKNKADYFIGTSKPTTLKNYFYEFDQKMRGLKINQISLDKNQDTSIFNTDEIYNDTGYISSTNRLNLNLKFK